MKTFGDEAALSPDRQETTVPDVIEKKDSEKIVIIPEIFRSDIRAIEEYAGQKLSGGANITVSLAELSSICPRSRRRLDSYRSLIGYLKDELNITLTIITKRK